MRITSSQYFSLICCGAALLAGCVVATFAGAAERGPIAFQKVIDHPALESKSVDLSRDR